MDCDYKTVGGEEIVGQLPHTADSNTPQDWIVFHAIGSLGGTLVEGRSLGVFNGTEEEVQAYCDTQATEFESDGAHLVGYKPTARLGL